MPRAASLLCLLSLAILGSCSAYDQRWDSTPIQAVNPTAPLSGKWEGTWQSDASDYKGHLEAIIDLPTQTIKDGVPIQQYKVNFLMRLFEVGASDYTVTLDATPMPDGRIHIEGQKDRGYYFGGIFRYEGYVDLDKHEFYCDYNSDKDVGTLKMRHIISEIQ